MKAIILSIAALLCVGVSSAASETPRYKPSFNCETATHSDERTICADAELSRLDNIAAASYNDVRRRHGDQFAKSINAPLFQARQACATDVDCIKAQQNVQIKIFFALDQSRVYVSPDGKSRALVYPVDLDVHSGESRIILSTSDGELLNTEDHSSPSGGHGHGILNAEWSPDSQFFAYIMESSGGHAPWHTPMRIYSREKNIFISFEEMIGNNAATTGGEFKFTGPHTISAVKYGYEKRGYKEEDVPVTVDLEEAIKKLTPSFN